MFENKAVILKTGNEVTIYRIEVISDFVNQNLVKLQKHYIIDIDGLAFGHQNSPRFRIVTSDLITFY